MIPKSVREPRNGPISRYDASKGYTLLEDTIAPDNNDYRSKFVDR